MLASLHRLFPAGVNVVLSSPSRENVFRLTLIAWLGAQAHFPTNHRTWKTGYANYLWVLPNGLHGGAFDRLRGKDAIQAKIMDVL
jgi:hypothetical protein